jgi:hypothetical protein
MKNSKTRRRTIRSKRYKRSKKTNKKRNTRGGYASTTNRNDEINVTGVIDYTATPNSTSPGPEWAFRYSCSTQNLPLRRMAAGTEERIVQRRDNRGWDVYITLVENMRPNTRS